MEKEIFVRKLKYSDKLIRSNYKNGTPCSAISDKDGHWWYWCERKFENAMVKRYYALINTKVYQAIPGLTDLADVPRFDSDVENRPYTDDDL